MDSIDMAIPITWNIVSNIGLAGLTLAVLAIPPRIMVDIE